MWEKGENHEKEIIIHFSYHSITDLDNGARINSHVCKEEEKEGRIIPFIFRG